LLIRNLIFRAGGSGIAPVTFWQGATRISSTPIEQQIAYLPHPPLSPNEHREAKAVVRALQEDLEKLERETVQSTNDLRGLRKSHAVEKRSAEEAKASKQRAEAALEDVREYLNSQGLGSGRVVAFQNAIDVSPRLRMRINGDRKPGPGRSST
jgi:hypothetical protein